MAITNPKSGVASVMAACALAASAALAQAPADGEQLQIEITPIDLTRPPANLREALRDGFKPGETVRLRDRRWYVKIRPIYQFGDGVPWEIRYENHPEARIQDFPAEQFDRDEHVLRVPTLQVSGEQWEEWFDEEMHDVVGIHVPHMARIENANILYTTHDMPAGSGAPPGVSRIEGTLVTPITWSLDQAIIIRQTTGVAEIRSRIAHERAHAVTAVQDLVDSIVGEQTWDPAAGTGRRANVVWAWRYQKVYQTWKRYREGEKELRMLRTYVTVLPPTRWSMLVGKPKGDVTPADLTALNADIALISGRYDTLRRHHQQKVHKELGPYTTSKPPPFRRRRGS